MKLKRYLKIYGALWKNSVVREMGFKTNFLLWIVVEMLWFALQLSFFAVIYTHTDRIGTWSKWQVVMLLGASHFIQQIFTAIFLTNCTQLSELIRTGKLDFMLLLPVNTRFHDCSRPSSPAPCPCCSSRTCRQDCLCGNSVRLSRCSCSWAWPLSACWFRRASGGSPSGITPAPVRNGGGWSRPENRFMP